MTNVSRSYENVELEDHKSESIFTKPPRKQGTKSENPYGDIHLNNESIKDISISNLWDVIMENSKNKNDGFKKEYAVCSYDIYNDSMF